MKKIFLLILCSFVFNGFLFANPIDQRQAVQIANKFLNGNSKLLSVQKKDKLTTDFIAKRSKTVSSLNFHSLKNSLASNLYYVINRGANNGFVVVAGDDVVSPVLAYSSTGHLDAFAIHHHPSIAWLFSEYERQLDYALSHAPKTNSVIKVYGDDDIMNIRNMRIVVKPLFRYRQDRTTLRQNYISFGQDWPFNDLCPNMRFKDNYGRARSVPTVSGCVATGISMVMRWHEWPLAPKGQVSYYWRNKYQMKLDFDKADAFNYNWKVMPEAVDSRGNNRDTGSKCTSAEASQISHLLRDVGYSVKMSYGIAQQGGSGTQVYYAPAALMQHFGYAQGCQWIKRYDYEKSSWIQQIVDELQNYGPIIYAGFSRGGGHCFCLDGYATNGTYADGSQPNDFVHVNWGWNKMEDGWYKLDILQPGSEGIGGGSGGYRTNQQMIRFLKPNRKASPKPTPKPDPTPTPTPTPTPDPEDGYSLHVETTNVVVKFDKNNTRQKYVVNISNSGSKSFYGKKIYLAVVNSNWGKAVGTEYAFIGRQASRSVTFHDLNFAKVPKGKYSLYIALENEEGKVHAVDKAIGECEVVDSSDKVEPQKTGPVITLVNPNETPRGSVIQGEKFRTEFILNNVGDEDFNNRVTVYIRPHNSSNRSLDQKIVSGTLEIKQNQELKTNVNTDPVNVQTGYYDIVVSYAQGGKEIYVKDDQGYDAVAGTLQVIAQTPDPDPNPNPSPTPQPVKPARVYASAARFYQDGKYLGSNYAVVDYGNGYSNKDFSVKTYITVENAPFSGKIKVFVADSPNGTVAVRPYGTVDYKEKVYTVSNLKNDNRYAMTTFDTQGLYLSKYYVNVMYQPSSDDRWYMIPNSGKAFYMDYSSYAYRGAYSDAPTQGPTFDFEETAVGSLGPGDDTNPEDGKEITKLESSFATKASVYPTITASTLNVKTERAAKATIYNIYGAAVKSFDLRKGDNLLSVESLNKGNYIIQFSGSSFRFIKK